MPRGFTISPDGARVLFLRTRSGTDPVHLPVGARHTATHVERLVVDPRALDADEENLPPEERARRERSREQAGGVVAYTTDSAGHPGGLRPVRRPLRHRGGQGRDPQAGDAGRGHRPAPVA
ncbi:hypothetical protein GCM10020219_090400 [Nonomuraea dietziae]